MSLVSSSVVASTEGNSRVWCAAPILVATRLSNTKSCAWLCWVLCKSACPWLSISRPEKIAVWKSITRNAKARASCVSFSTDVSKETNVFAAQRWYASNISFCICEYCANDIARCLNAPQVADGIFVTTAVSCCEATMLVGRASNDCHRAAAQARERGARAAMLWSSRARRRSTSFLYATAVEARVVFRLPRFATVQRWSAAGAPRCGRR